MSRSDPRMSVLALVTLQGDDTRSALAHLNESLAIAATLACPLDLLLVADPRLAACEQILQAASAGGARCNWHFDNSARGPASEADVSLAVEQLLAARADAIDGSTLVLLDADGGEEAAGRLAHRTGGSLLGVCGNAFARDPEGLVAQRVVFGGKVAAQIVAANGPWIACVRASGNASRLLTGNPPANGSATEVVMLPRPERIEASLATTNEPAGGDAADIGNAVLIVAGGRGVGEAGFDAIRTFAAKLGAAWAGSLPTVDAGWVPVSRQVGQSGRHVDPEVYLTVGISGTPQHLAGVGDRARIVAINKDADADIFRFAEVGIVAQWEDVLPSLIEQAGREQVNT